MRLWLLVTAFDFPHQILTYIRYPDGQTLLIASDYSAENATSPLA